MNFVTFKFWVTLEFSRRHGNLKPKCFDFCTSQLIGLDHFIINDWNYLVFWKKLAINQVLCFQSVSVYYIGMRDGTKEEWKKMVKINLSILVFCPTTYLANLKVYMKFEDSGSHRS